ncbi:phosphatidylinositol-4,5-diphosphate 3-kinase [Thraustotheca clavata]|uniref:Phosphatidylinositol-4,5-diphosphate 3-kinase n=1 Tax=Thraustotheca clavata TaxID=74557 RepID=A0A1W0A3R4_9STRA|nr:phosphatidylinositol-4,5-diphosphate 3-kinase [Thraustotheca clavata]
MNNDLWEMMEDEQVGVYFRNQMTMETRWTLPIEALGKCLLPDLNRTDENNEDDEKNDENGDTELFLEKEEEEIITRWSMRASSLVYDDENRSSCPRSSAGHDQSGLNQFDSIADGGVFEQQECVHAIQSLRTWIQQFPSLVDLSILYGKLQFPMYTRSVHYTTDHDYHDYHVTISVHYNGDSYIVDSRKSDTVFTLLLKSVQHFSINKTMEPIYHPFALEVVGRNDYLVDDTLTLGEYSYIHTSFRDKMIAKLCLLELSEDDAKVKVDSILSGQKDKTLYKAISFNRANRSKLNTIKRSSVQWPFRVKIHSLAQLKHDSRMSQVVVSVCLWTGPVTRLVSTHCIFSPPSNEPSTHENLETKPLNINMESNILSWEGHNWLAFTPSYNELPSSTRLAFIVYGMLPENKNQKLIVKRIALAAAWIPIEDVNGCISGGHRLVSLWPCSMTPQDFNSGVFPLGFPTTMNPRKNHGILSFELDEFDAPLQSNYSIPLSPTMPTCKSIANSDFLTLRSLEHVNMLYELSHTEKLILWQNRYYCCQIPRLLLVFLRSINWGCVKAVEEARKLILTWKCDGDTYLDCIQLLGHEVPDPVVRTWAVEQLHKLPDDTLQEFLLQLVQVLKYEFFADSALSRFLLFRSILNPVQLGQQFFWLLKTEVDDWLHASSVILAAYLSLNPPHRNLLFEQCRIVDQLELIAQRVKQVSKRERLFCLHQELNMLDGTITQNMVFHLCLSLRFACKSIQVENCKVMSSAKKPLWITFENADPLGEPISAIFKHGDDLRQDLLTLQQLRLMDKLWESNGLDIRLKPYQCQSIGYHLGMIEVIPKSKTTAHIHRDHGHIYFGAWMTTPIESFLKNQATGDNSISFSDAVDNFIRTCAGYCVATYVLGIGDRHSDNIMVTNSGHLFHIDFGHFLGNFKVKFGVKRERAPFVLTPEMAFVMRSSNTETRFEVFEQLCCEAYNLLRHQNALWITLFALMVPAQVPEMTSFSDITYIQQQLSLELSDKEAAAKFENEIKNALACTSRRVDNWMHNMKHGINIFTS